VGGYEVPDDRFVDGVDQLDFFIGSQSQSSREGFQIYGLPVNSMLTSGVIGSYTS
jgi:hypothetical protein